MFKFKQILINKTFAFVSWKKDNSMDYADVVVFGDINPDPELMESWLPDQELYETKIVSLYTDRPITQSDVYNDVLCTGKLYCREVYRYKEKNKDEYCLEVEDLPKDTPGHLKYIPIIGMREFR